MSEQNITKGSKSLEEIEDCLRDRLQITDLIRLNRETNTKLVQKTAEASEIRKAYEQSNKSHQAALKSITKAMGDIAKVFDWIFKKHPELKEEALKKCPQIKGNVIL